MIKDIISIIKTLQDELHLLTVDRQQHEKDLKISKATEDKMILKIEKEKQTVKKILKLAKESRAIIEIDKNLYLVEVWYNSVKVEKLPDHKEIDTKLAIAKLVKK